MLCAASVVNPIKRVHAGIVPCNSRSVDTKGWMLPSGDSAGVDRDVGLAVLCFEIVLQSLLGSVCKIRVIGGVDGGFI